MPARDPYEVLGVSADADDAEIRRAFQKIARRSHPDVAPADAASEARFAEAAQAFEVLSDPDLRRRYDASRRRGDEPEWAARWSAAEEVVEAPGGTVRRSTRWVEVRRGRRPPAVRSGRAGERDAGGAVAAKGIRDEGPRSTPGVVGSSDAGAGRPAGAEAGRLERPERRGDARAPAAEAVTPVEAVLDFAEAVRGTTRSFPLQREIGCPECGGSGEVGGGGGESWTGECGRCGGRGALVELERVRVRLPRAVEDGARLRIPGRGAPLAPGRQSDLEIRVRVRPHPYFRREGPDVHADLPVTLAEAVLGADVEVPTIDGPVRVTLPPGTSGGRRFRLRGRGLTPPGGEPGDHYFRVMIVLPERIGEELRRAVRGGRGPDPRGDLPRKPI